MTEETPTPETTTPTTDPVAKSEIPAEDDHEGWFHRDNATTAIILQPQGDVEILDANAGTLKGNGGTYVVETRGRFWLPQPVPAGWLTVFVHNNPEPVTERPPVGYSAKTVEFLLGPYIPHVLGGGFQGRQQAGRLWVWVIAIALVLAAAAAIAIWAKGGL